MLLYIWQLPQNIVGLLILLINRRNVYFHENHFCVKHLSDCGISLGKYIIIDQDSWHNLNTIKHEQGHQKQSLYLGWFYLLLIGLPSVIGNVLHRFIKFDYYAQPWEAWADRLGGVNRTSY